MEGDVCEHKVNKNYPHFNSTENLSNPPTYMRICPKKQVYSSPKQHKAE